MKYIFKLCSLVLLVVLASCQKQLNVLPTTEEVDGNIIVDQKSAVTALNGIYFLFAHADYSANGIPDVQWCDMHEVIPSELSGLTDYISYSPEYATHSYTAASILDMYSLWTYDYKIINAANGFIKNITPVTDVATADKRAMIAEAKFLRAYANAGLLFNYGQYQDISSPYGIILRKELVTASNIKQPRSTVKESYDFILDDLDSAIAAMPDRNTQIFYANVWAAKLLKARVLMERAGDGDYSGVIGLCRDIISHSGFTLEDSSKDIFLTKGLSSQEVMFGVKPYPNDVYKYRAYSYDFRIAATDLMLHLFQQDPRAPWMIKQVNYPGIGDINAVTKYYPNPGPDISDWTPQPLSSVGYVMRLTEAYLLEAEAITASGGGLNEAKTLLKTVLRHAGFTAFPQVDAAATPDELRTLIIRETMKNLMCEAGQSWMAVRRLPFATIQQMLPTIEDKLQLILPIPQTEMMKNAALKGMQNPGYGK